MAIRAAEAAAEAAVERVLAAMTPAAPASQQPNEMLAFVQQLARSIAEVGNQGTGKVVVDPAVIQQREDARIEMMALIAEAYRDVAKPEYVLRGKVHLADRLIEPLWVDPATRRSQPTKVIWYGPPNKQMEPVPGNVAAEKIHNAMCRWIGHVPGITASLRTIDPKGRLVTPGGNVFSDLEPIPKQYMGEELLQIEAGALPSRGVPLNGLEVHGNQPGSNKTMPVHILGTVVEPARQQVA
jgi:hypothetical protein